MTDTPTAQGREGPIRPEWLEPLSKTPPDPDAARTLLLEVRDSHDDPERYHGLVARFDSGELNEAEAEAEARQILRLPDATGDPLPVPLTGEGWKADVPDREWLVDDWLPVGELALLAGPGETGKSLLTLQLATALACDRDVFPDQDLTHWLPRQSGKTQAPALCPEPVNVVLAGWEDSTPEALRRRNRLYQFGDCKWAADPSINDRLHGLPMRGRGPVWAPAASGSRHIATVGELTQTGHELRAYCERIEARLLVLDPSSLALALAENDRALVSLALESWAGWANACGCAVLLTAHPAKATEGEAADYSGSTAWRGLVRAMWTLKLPSKKDKSDIRFKRPARLPEEERFAELALNKSNYSMSGAALPVATRGKRAGWCIVEATEQEKMRKQEPPKTADDPLNSHLTREEEALV